MFPFSGNARNEARNDCLLRYGSLPALQLLSVRGIGKGRIFGVSDIEGQLVFSVARALANSFCATGSVTGARSPPIWRLFPLGYWSAVASSGRLLREFQRNRSFGRIHVLLGDSVRLCLQCNSFSTAASAVSKRARREWLCGSFAATGTECSIQTRSTTALVGSRVRQRPVRTQE